MIGNKEHIGELEHRLEILTDNSSTDSMGGRIPNWSTAVTIWGRITPLSGKQRSQLANIDSSISHEITIRYRPDLTFSSDMLIRYNGREFAIKSLYNIDEQNNYIKIMAVEQ